MSEKILHTAGEKKLTPCESATHLQRAKFQYKELPQFALEKFGSLKLKSLLDNGESQTIQRLALARCKWVKNPRRFEALIRCRIARKKYFGRPRRHAPRNRCDRYFFYIDLFHNQNDWHLENDAFGFFALKKLKARSERTRQKLLK